MYEYQGTIFRIVDGDTVQMQLDLGCDVKLNVTLRLLGINAPEHGTREGEMATDALHRITGIYARGRPLIVRTTKDKKEKYGRYLATLIGWHEDGSECDLNERMIELGHAVPYDGGAR